MIRISVIIPVFNAERYLKRCLDSVLEALEGVSGEILVVDNGSSDDSLKIAQKYQKSRPRASISVLSCPTPGAAAARNLGAKQAKGEYIWFVDADDYICPDSLILIKEYLRKHKIIDFLTLRFSRDKLILPYSDHLFQGNGVNYLLQREPNGYLWAKIIKRQVIEDHNIRFNSKLFSQEDWLFLLEIYPHVNELHETNILAYQYCTDNEHSVMRENTKENNLQHVKSSILVLTLFKNFIAGRGQQDHRRPAREGQPPDQEDFRGKVPRPEISRPFSRILNTSAAGLLYCILPLQWNKEDVNQVISQLQSAGIYPIGDTGKWKYNLFLKIANHKFLFNLLVLLKKL